MSTVYDEKLLDKIGMAMVPSGYTNNAADEGNAGGALGKVYSVLPIQTTSDNLVTNGDFSDGSTGWDTSIGTAFIANGVAEWPDTTNSFVRQFSVVDSRVKTYILTYTVKTSNQGYLMLGGGSSAFGTVTLPNTVGTHSVTLTSNGITALQFFNNSSFVGTIDDISLVKVINGDFDFSRGSDATRVNSQGYIESVQVLSDELVQNGDFEEIGSELVTNGGFDTDSDWDIVNNTGTASEIINGYARIKTDGTYTQIDQTNVTISAKSYKLQYTILETDGGSLGFIITGNQTVSIPSTVGTHTYYFVAHSTSIVFKRFSGALDIKLDNVSVKEVGQNWDFTSGSSFTENGIRIQADGTYENFSQDNVMTVGKTYKVTYEVTEVNSGGIKFNTSFGLNSGVPSTLGIHSIYATANISNLFFERNGVTDITIDNISVKEVTDDTDIPRLDYTNQACPSLLLEPQRSNLFTTSVDFTGISPLSATSAPVSITSPDGTTNGVEKITATSTNQARIEEQLFPSTLDDNYTWSIFVKKDTARYVGLSHYSESGNVVIFDLDNGTIVSESGSLPAKIEVFANGWYRISKGAYLPSGITSSAFKFHLCTESSAFTSVVGESAYVYGLQIEEGSYPTSYIPTNGLLVTRRADVCNNAGDSTIFNDSEGVLFVEMAALADDLTYRTVSISDGTDDNRVNIRYRPTSNAINGLISGGGSVVFNSSYVAQDVTDFSKIALKYKSGDIALWVNGSEVLPNTASFGINGLNTISFDKGDGNDIFYGNVRQVLYFNEALSDAELEYITSADIDLTIHNYKGSLSKISATYEDVGVKDRLTKLF